MDLNDMIQLLLEFNYVEEKVVYMKMCVLRQIAGVSGISGRAEAKPIQARRSPIKKTEKKYHEEVVMVWNHNNLKQNIRALCHSLYISLIVLRTQKGIS